MLCVAAGSNRKHPPKATVWTWKLGWSICVFVCVGHTNEPELLEALSHSRGGCCRVD